MFVSDYDCHDYFWKYYLGVSFPSLVIEILNETQGSIVLILLLIYMIFSNIAAIQLTLLHNGSVTTQFTKI
jgi:hypothetical protein